MTKDEISAIQVGKIIQAVETIEEATAKITSVIYDQGGLVERTIKIEQAAIAVQTEMDAVGEFRANTTSTLERIEKLIEGHHADKELHSFKGLILKLPILGGMFLFVAFVHTIIPPTLNLWELIEKFLGI